VRSLDQLKGQGLKRLNDLLHNVPMQTFYCLGFSFVKFTHEFTLAGHGKGSLATVHAVVPKSGGLGSTTLVTCSAPQPSVVPRRHAARCCGVQQQCRWRPHVPRPGEGESARRARTRSPRQRHAAAARLPSSRVVGGALAGRASQRLASALRKKWWLLSHLSSAPDRTLPPRATDR